MPRNSPFGVQSERLLTIFRGGARNFPMRGLTEGFQGTIIATNLRKYNFLPSDGGLACSDEEL